MSTGGSGSDLGCGSIWGPVMSYVRSAPGAAAVTLVGVGGGRECQVA